MKTRDSGDMFHETDRTTPARDARGRFTGAWTEAADFTRRTRTRNTGTPMTRTRSRTVAPYGDALSKKDFVAIATTLGAISDPVRRHEETARWIPTLLAQNPRFDELRFRRYVEQAATKRVAKAAEFTTRGTRTRSRATW
jgi:hypothetical protein